MKWEEIEKIIKNEGGKFIIVEDGEPRLVITSFDDYKNRSGNQMNNVEGQRKDGSESLQDNEERSGPVDSGDELTIDDLPL